MAETRSALIVANDTYDDPGLARLRAPSHDAEALGRVLGDERIGGFQVETLRNEPAHEVTRAIEDFFAERRAEDLLLLHLSCHGVKDEAGELHFATRNTALRRLASTSVSADFVNRRITRTRSRRVVLLLDCCYAGAFERGLTARAGSTMAIEEQFGGRGRAVITASSAMEYAFEGETLADADAGAPSVFTSALVEGLDTGEADQDQDGLVSLDELYDYVYTRVRQATPNQTPSKWAFGLQGDLYVARRARPVLVPSALPIELQQALDHPLPGVRAATVKDLERLLVGTHAGLALAARRALEVLIDDDSRTVAAAASATLASAPDVESGVEFPPAMPAEPRAQEVSPVAVPTVTVEPELTPVSPVEPEPGPAPPVEPEPGPAPPAELVPDARAPVEASAASSAPNRESAPPRQSVGWLTGASAACLVGSLFVPFAWEYRLDMLASELALGTMLLALAVATVCAVAMSRRGRRLVALGLAVGVGVAATVPVVWLLSGLTNDDLVVRFGFWLQLAGLLLLVGAAGKAARALRGDARVRLLTPSLRAQWGSLPWWIVVVGLIAALALVAHTADVWELMANPAERSRVHATLWLVVLTIVVPPLAATVVPRHVAGAVLGGWAFVASILFLQQYGFLDRMLRDFGWYTARGPLLVFGAAALVLVAAAVWIGFGATISTQTTDADEERPPAPV